MKFFPHATSRHGSPFSHPSCRRTAQARNSRASYFHHQKSKIQNLKFGESAFSLTEVVIAMGVAAVAFTSIIALFPLGLNMSKESYEATQAALIAQTIMSDLRDQVSSTSGKLIQKTGTNAMSLANYETIPMTASSGGTDRYIYLAYDQQIRTDSTNSPIMLRPRISSVSLSGPNEPSWFTNGTNGPIVLVKVSLKHSFRMSAAGTANPQRVDVTIESPANAKATNRVQYVFSGIIPQA
jgi:Tfp pilus assembly protein PilV